MPVSFGATIWSWSVATGIVLGAMSAASMAPAFAQPGETTSVDAPAKPAKAHPLDAIPPAPTYNLPQIERINTEVRQAWRDSNLLPSPPATDGEWCRRVYLDVLGRVPSVQELNQFLASKDPEKKRTLVESLLRDDQYVEEYARNWTTVWTNLLIGRAGGTADNTLISRDGMMKYLRDSFARNKPYDKLVNELITATGSTSPGAENFNGAVNFLVDKVNDENGSLATADTSRIFLGLQVQCTQCHNHPFNEWKQQKFWEMNAFFRQSRALRRFVPGTRDIASAELVDQDFAGESRNAREADVFYELRNGQLKVAFPVFVDGQEIPRSGYVSDVVRRQKLGDFVTQSPFLAKTAVNRAWSHFLGYGFTKPVDDLGPHNPPSHPALLEYVAEEFANGGYNVKDLIRWITLSEPYALSSRTTKDNQRDDPLMGERPMFTHFYLRQMSAEQLYESLLVATQAHKNRGTYEQQEAKKTEWLGQFVQAFGTDEGGEATSFNGTIPQVLMMFNGDLVKQATSIEGGSFLAVIAASSLKPAQKIEYLYMAGLARKPSRQELQMANMLLSARKGNTAEALQDIWWAILNSNEFIIAH